MLLPCVSHWSVYWSIHWSLNIVTSATNWKNSEIYWSTYWSIHWTALAVASHAVELLWHSSGARGLVQKKNLRSDMGWKGRKAFWLEPHLNEAPI